MVVFLFSAMIFLRYVDDRPYMTLELKVKSKIFNTVSYLAYLLNSTDGKDENLKESKYPLYTCYFKTF